jgi:hypothetical protein
MGIKEMFGDHKKVIKHFLNWCKELEELCEYDYEHLCITLELGSLDLPIKLIHFSNSNILDYLEEQGYYIGLPLRGEFKFVTVVHYNSKGNVSQRPLYSNSGVKDRNRALVLGIQRAIKDLETKL